MDRFGWGNMELNVWTEKDGRRGRYVEFTCVPLGKKGKTSESAEVLKNGERETMYDYIYPAQQGDKSFYSGFDLGPLAFSFAYHWGDSAWPNTLTAILLSSWLLLYITGPGMGRLKHLYSFCTTQQIYCSRTQPSEEYICKAPSFCQNSSMRLSAILHSLQLYPNSRFLSNIKIAKQGSSSPPGNLRTTGLG